MGSDIRTVALVVIAAILAVAALVFAHALLVPLTVGILLSYMLEPAVALLVRWRIPRLIGATLVFVATIALVTGGAYSLRHQATVALDNLPTAMARLRVALQDRMAAHSTPHPVTQMEKAAAELRRLIGEPETLKRPAIEVAPAPHPFQIPEAVWTGSLTITELISDIVIVLVLAYYLLIAGDFFRRRLIEIAGPTLSEKKITLQILENISTQIERYVFVRALISVIVALLTASLLWLIGLPQAGLWGAAAGALNIVPYVGSGSVAVAAALAGFLQFRSFSMALATGGIVVGVAVLEAYGLTPWLSSRAGAMNPAAVFVGLVFWGWVWGVPGLLLAVPMLMITKAVCEHVDVLEPVATLLGA